MNRSLASPLAMAFGAAFSTACGSAGVTAGSDDAGIDAPPVVSTSCDNAQLSKGCVAERCRVTATVSPLPKRATLTVTQRPAPPGLIGDAIDGILCDIAVSGGVSSV